MVGNSKEFDQPGLPEAKVPASKESEWQVELLPGKNVNVGATPMQTPT